MRQTTRETTHTMSLSRRTSERVQSSSGAALNGSGERAVKEGWLHKMGGASKNKWQSRWCSLQGRALCYYSKKEDSHMQGSINIDEVLDISRVGDHAGKEFCFSLVATKGNSKKVYYLAAGDEASLNEWYSVLTCTDHEPSQKLVKYATAEVFLTQGIRIAGDVHYNILSSLAQRVPVEKKKRDIFGWFCDRPVALAAVLNLFVEYGWTPERVYRSTGVSAVDNSIHPVIRVILSKSPLGENSALLTSSDKHDTLCKSGKQASVVSLSIPPSPATTASFQAHLGELLEGSDEELIELMREFDIPLTLLQVSSAGP